MKIKIACISVVYKRFLNIPNLQILRNIKLILIKKAIFWERNTL